MSIATNKAVVQRWFDEVWNRGNTAVIDELFDPNGIAHGLDGTEARGPGEFKPFHKKLREAIPDIHITLVEILGEGDMTAARCIVRGTHKGCSLGCAATHKPIEFEGVTVNRIVNGKIVEGWNYFDFMRLYKTVGMLP